MDDGAGDLPPAACVVVAAFAFELLDLWASAFLRFLRPALSFSAFSIMTLEMRSNSEQMPSIRCTPPVSTSWPRADRKVTTMLSSLVSDRARGSRGFCSILPNRVTSADTGKYSTILLMLVLFHEGSGSKDRTYHTTDESPSGMYLSNEIVALAAEVHNAAELKTLGFKGLAFSP